MDSKTVSTTSTIRLDAISKHFGGHEVLKNVSFAVKKGDIFGYLGPNGAGKTTTIRILLGLLQATAGKVSILGHDPGDCQTRTRIGFILESDGLYENMTAIENLTYYARIYGLHQTEGIDKALKLVGLADRAGDKVGTYSRGMRQRLTLARATVHNPEILILDEPTAGIDPAGQIEIREIMLDLAHQQGKTIFLSSHNLDEVQRICNYIALIDGGEIKLCGELDSLKNKMSGGEILIETGETIAEPVLAELMQSGGITVRHRTDKTLVLSIGENNSVSNIVAFLVQRGVAIEQIKRKDVPLEEIYTSILKRHGDFNE